MADLSSALGGLGGLGTIGKAIVQLQLDSKKYLAEMEAAKAETTAGANSMSKGFLGFASGAKAGLAAVGVGVVAFVSKSVQGFQEVATETRTLEKQLGVTAQQASVLRAQGEALGVGVDKLSIGFGIFAKHLVANDATIQKYGIDVARTADGSIDFQNVLGQVSDKFQTMGPGIGRTAAAMNLFGRSGKSLLPLLSADSSELAKLAQHAREAGLVMSEDDVNAARAFSIAQRQLGESVKGLEVSLARALIPALTQLTDAFSELLTKAGPILGFFGDLLGTVLQGAADNLTTIVDAIGTLTKAESDNVEEGFTWQEHLGGLGHSLLTLGNLVQDIRHPVGQFKQALDEAFTDPSTRKGIEDTTTETQKLADRVSRFAGLGKKAFADFEKSVGESMQVAVGDFKKLNEAFDTTPKQLKRQLDLALKIARTYADDLNTIMSDPELSDRQKKALAELPANQRHAFAEAGDEGRKEIAKQAVRLQGANRDAMTAVAKAGQEKAKSGGTETGKLLMDGVAIGIVNGKKRAIAEGGTAIDEVVSNMKQHAGAHSPSVIMHQLGVDLMQGLANGIQDSDQKVFDQLNKVYDKMLQDRKDALSKAREAAKSFGGGISGGFSEYSDLVGAYGNQDLSGMNITQLLNYQKGLAQGQAELLDELRKGGASKGLISQIAAAGQGGYGFAQALYQGGPETIKLANDTLSGIQDIADKTGKALTRDFFGQQIQDLKGRVDHLGDRMEHVIEKIGDHYHDIVVDGSRLASAVSQNATRRGTRNGGNTGF